MVMSIRLHRAAVMLLACLMPINGTQARMLPLMGGFKDSTFTGTVDMPWPVLFENCTFKTDSIVLKRSNGAVFRNCTIESGTGTLYMTGSGNGLILVDCEVNGCKEIRFSRNASVTDRNYVTGVRMNGHECAVLDDQESIIEIDGLELDNCVRGELAEPVILVMTTDKNTLKAGETAVLCVHGLDDGMFLGWHADSLVSIQVGEPMVCRVTAPESITENSSVLVSAYTEYGLEAACVIKLDCGKTIKEDKKSRKKKK